MTYFAYNKKQFHSNTGSSIYESDIVISTKVAFDVIFDEIISNRNFSSNGIPTKLMELYNKFVRIIGNEMLKGNDKKEMVKNIVKQLLKEVKNKFKSERIINAINNIKFNQG